MSQSQVEITTSNFQEEDVFSSVDQNAELETKHQKYKGRIVIPRRPCERWFWILCSIHWTRIISISNDGGKSHRYHIQIVRVRRTSSWCSICFFLGKNRRCSKIIENSQTRMSRHLDSSITTQMAIIMVQHGRPSRSSWAKSLWSSFGKTVMGKTILRKSYWSMVGRRFPIGNAFSYTVKKGYSYLCMWITSNWLDTQQRSWFGRTNIFPWSCISEALKDRVK